MNASTYGPFANLVAIGGALVATFGLMLLKMLPGLKRWTSLTADTPSFLVSAGARAFAVALMAFTYIEIDPTNVQYFGILTIVSGLLCFVSVRRFDWLRRLYVVPIPLVAVNGSQRQDKHGNLLFKTVVIGTEDEMRSDATLALAEARKDRGGLSLAEFLSGYGTPNVNDPGSIWDRDVLVRHAMQVTGALMNTTLSAVMTLFLGSFIIDVASRT